MVTVGDPANILLCRRFWLGLTRDGAVLAEEAA
jgi:hypothetical protein